MAAATIDPDATEELASSPEGEYGACRDGTPSENPEPSSADEPLSEQSKDVLVWRMPWKIATGFFFFFYIFWFVMVIILRYWVKEDWEKALPGLGKTALRKFTIRNHMTFGGIAILCSPIQLFTPFTAAWKKRGVNNWYRKVHRYSGRVYVICAILSFIFGQWFIFLKEFVLVGGYNMGVAFSAAGFAIAYFAYMTWKTAPTNNPDGRYTVTDHRNWAIRSVAQIVAPVLYRYWYTLLLIFKVYQTPYLNGGDNEGKDKLVCNDRDVCGDYLRPFDFLFCWLYWLSAWAVAEIIILFLPEHKSSATMPGSEDPMEAPLLTTTPESGGNSNAMENGQVEGSDNKSAPRVVNFVGCLLAVLTIVVSGPIMIGLVASIFKKK